MARVKHTKDQVLVKLREVDRLCKTGQTVKQAVECVGITDKTYYCWRKKYGWMTADEYQRMKELETENERLKELVRLWATTMGEPGPLAKMKGGGSHARQAYDR